MGRVARLGVVCLMGLAVGLARLVEVELDPGPRAPLVVALPAAAVPPPEESPVPLAAPMPAQPAAAPAPTQTPAPGPVVGAADAEWPAGRIYVVQSGDTLGTIAQKTLGSARHWKRLHDANRKAIPDPGRMRAGTRLVLPEVAPASGR